MRVQSAHMAVQNSPRVFPVLRALSYLEAGVNPYLYDHNELLKFTNWQKVQIALGTVFLLPIRVILITVIVLIGWLLSLMILIGLKSSTDIYKGWRRKLCWVLIVFSRVSLMCFGYWRIKVKGSPAPREEAPILAVPLHSSWLDFLATAIVDGQVIPIGLHREENKRIPLFHTMVIATQQIYVSRTNAGSRNSALEQIKERALDNTWPRLLIFPEGLCTNRKALVPFKKGVFIAGCPIQPMVYRYPSDVDITTWTWNGLLPHKSIYLTLCRLVNHMEIEYYPVYTPSEEERKDPLLYASNVQKLLSRTLGLPTIEYTLADVKAMMGHWDNRVPVSKGMTEFIKFEDKLRIGLSDLRARVTDFRTDTDGYVNAEEFATYLNLPASHELWEIFDLYNKNADGKINLREYLISVVLMCHPSCTNETMQVAFEIFDENGCGSVDRSGLKHILSAAFQGVDDKFVDEIYAAAELGNQGMISYDEFAQFCSRRTDLKFFSRHYQVAKDGEQGQHRMQPEHAKVD